MKEKILAEIERLKRWNDNVRESTRHMTVQEEDYNRGKNSSYLELLDFINSLPEEPVSDDLIQASEEYVSPWQVYAEDTDGELLLTSEPCERAFVSGAQWQKKVFISKACDWLTKHAKKYYFNEKGYLGTDELVEDFKLIMEM